MTTLITDPRKWVVQDPSKIELRTAHQDAVGALFGVAYTAPMTRVVRLEGTENYHKEITVYGV